MLLGFIEVVVLLVLLVALISIVGGWFVFVNSGGYMVTLEKLVDDDDNT
jgi:hypothetical protein